MKLRLAPSATGLLHVGNARIALANFLLARRNNARVVLRLDDADPERTRPDYVEAIEYDLRWLGLEWDTLVRQSERTERYTAAAEKLKESGRLYPCFESEEELNAKREQRQRRSQAAIYDRGMLKLTPEQRATAEAGGKRPYWRFLLSGVPAEWGDMVLGRQEVKLSAVSDPVLIRADGTPAQAFTSAVDDIELGITHLIRSEEDVTASGIQLDIMAALGATGRTAPIRFGHLPALTDQQGAKLGTRSGGPLSLRSLRGDGIEPSALTGYLARLGTPEAAVAETPAAMAPGYDLTRIAKAAARFDARHLLALNRRTLQAMPFEAVRDRLPPAATPAFWQAVRGSLDLMREARGWWDVVTGTIVPPLVEGEAEYLHQALDLLPPEPWDDTTWPGWTHALRAASGRKGKQSLIPLRLALTGEDHGPELAELLPLIGRARVVERLRLAAS